MPILLEQGCRLAKTEDLTTGNDWGAFERASIGAIRR